MAAMSYRNRWDAAHRGIILNSDSCKATVVEQNKLPLSWGIETWPSVCCYFISKLKNKQWHSAPLYTHGWMLSPAVRMITSPINLHKRAVVFPPHLHPYLKPVNTSGLVFFHQICYPILPVACTEVELGSSDPTAPWKHTPQDLLSKTLLLHLLLPSFLLP